MVDKKFFEISYKKNGRDFDFCDCYGLCYLYNKVILDKKIPIYLNEKIDTDHEVNNTINTRSFDFKNVLRGKETEGDIISFRIKGSPTHVGVVLQMGLMIHIIENKKAVIESYSNLRWKNKVDSFWRYESII